MPILNSMALPGADFYLPDGFAEIGSDEIPITSYPNRSGESY